MTLEEYIRIQEQRKRLLDTQRVGMGGGMYTPGPDAAPEIGYDAKAIEKQRKGMSQEALEGFKELRYDLEAAADRNIRKARKSVEGVDFAEVKMPQPGLAVEDYAPVSNLGLMPSITGGSKEQRGWKADKDDELWSLLSRGLRR